MMIVLKIIATIFLCICEVQSLEGGVKVQITQRGLNYAANFIADKLSEDVPNMQIPDYSGETNGIQYQIFEVKITKLSFLQPTVNVSPTNLTLDLKGYSLLGVGKWNYTYSKWVLKFSDGGSFAISANGISIQVLITVGLNGTMPIIRANSVECKIDNVVIKLHGGASWLYNLLLGMYTKKLSSSFEQAVEKSLMYEINVKAQQMLTSLSWQSTIFNKYTMNYRLTAPPFLGSNFIETTHAGTFSNDDLNTDVVPMTMAPRKMVGIAVSQVTLNNFARAVFASGQLVYKDADYNLASLSQYLNHTILNGVSSVHVETRALNPPNIILTVEGLQYLIDANINITVAYQNGTQSTLLNANINAVANASLDIDNDSIKTKLSWAKVSSKIISSSLAKLDENHLNGILKKVVRRLIPVVNKKEGGGFKLPNIKDLAFKNGRIHFFNGYLVVSTDVK